MKKRILHLVYSNIYSGAENVAINIINTLSEEYELIYASPEGPIESILLSNNIRHIPLKSFNPLYLNSIFRKWKPDIIHTHDFRASINTSLSLYPCRIISHLHNNPSWIRKINLYSICYAISSLAYNKIITVSSEVLSEAIFSKMLSEKYTVLPNIVNIERIIRASNSEIIDNNFDIGFIGRLTEQKDPLRFLEIVSEVKKKIPNIKVVLIGDGELKVKCKEAIDRLNLQKNVQMLGFKSNPFPILKKTKILLMPSKWEGFGLVAVESMALGIPVFASPVGGLNGIINNGCGELCESNEDFIEQAIKSLLEPQYYSFLSKNCRKNALNFGNIDIWKNKIINLYEV
ncbi:glycosyl transferase family 1 [Paenibacillus albidus]|uniref:Glycosyl transferase family 1 n=1 Tax=Paenibacillus albidus TaxID=2041023 RepID=A0A917F9R3_9BACL|nr:glycosyltransferase [Paenibacillus albidus]GGF58919.1 glycosyl transferase family 1 [Paenibacillus albidus]